MVFKYNIFSVLLLISIPFYLMCQMTGTRTHDISPSVEQEITKMKFESRHIDLGKVKKGDNIPFKYSFINTGNTDLSIDFISGCDCTELDWPLKTFKPGEKGEIEVVFLSGKKEKSERVEIDILLKNVVPQTQNPILEIISYSYEF